VDARSSKRDSTYRSRVAFVCAMPMELTPLVERLALREVDVDGATVHTGTLGELEVVAIVTGMGTALAAAGLERLLAAMPVDRVLVVGITGALENDTPIGTLVLPELVVHSGTGSEHRPHHLADEPARGTMWTTDVLLTDPDVLADLRARGVVSLDMETAALAAVCDAWGIPWSVFRAISDRASDGTVNEEVFRMSNQDGTPNHEAIAAYFAAHPDHAERLAEMGEAAALATRVAADAAVLACSRL
jgi:adenosylhomocysteine nucleosidase